MTHFSNFNSFNPHFGIHPSILNLRIYKSNQLQVSLVYPSIKLSITVATMATFGTRDEVFEAMNREQMESGGYVLSECHRLGFPSL